METKKQFTGKRRTTQLAGVTSSPGNKTAHIWETGAAQTKTLSAQSSTNGAVTSPAVCVDVFVGGSASLSSAARLHTAVSASGASLREQKTNKDAAAAELWAGQTPTLLMTPDYL